jgi:hypothetical protein
VVERAQDAGTCATLRASWRARTRIQTTRKSTKTAGQFTFLHMDAHRSCRTTNGGGGGGGGAHGTAAALDARDARDNTPKHPVHNLVQHLGVH